MRILRLVMKEPHEAPGNEHVERHHGKDEYRLWKKDRAESVVHR